ncbi:MAG: MFS transporter, partial [Jatrophihabitantaceae bacterium]
DIVDPASRVRLAAYSRAVLNVGVSVGALLASVALASGGRTAFNAILLGNAASCVIAAGLLSRIKVRPRTPAADPGPSDEPAPPDRHPLLQPRLVSAATICGILFLSAAILDVGLPLQVAEHSSAPTWVIGLLLVVNTVMAVTLQVVTSRGAHTVAGAARANRIAGLALLACCLVFPLSSHGPAGPAIVVLIVATVLLTMGELYSSAGSWGLSYGLADTEQEGKYLASFGLLSQFIQVFGPLLATVVVGVGMLGWITVGVVFALSGYLAPKITPG